MGIQMALGSNLAMPAHESRAVSVQIRLYGAQRRNDNALSKKMPGESGNGNPETGRRQRLFDIIQGPTFDDVRQSSAQRLTILTWPATQLAA
jgi:tRNA-guanine family transglycosylase